MNWSKQLKFLLNDEAAQLYSHRFLYTLALSAISLFLPLYLYEQGFSIASIATFFIVQFGIGVFGIHFASRIISKIGLRKSALAATPILMVFYLSIRLLETRPELLLPLAVLEGIGNTIYWLAMNSEMSRVSQNRNSDQQTGLFFSLPKIGAVISPAIGGVIVAFAGFNALFMASGAMMLISFLPFLRSGDTKVKKAGFQQIYRIKDRNYFLTFFFEGASSVGGILVWPLFIGTVLTGSLGIGGAGSIISIGGAFFSAALGKYSSTSNRHAIMKTGGTMFAGSWVTMSIVATPAQAFIVSLANGMLAYTVTIPIYSKVIDSTGTHNSLEYFASRETALNTGRVVLLGILGALFAVFDLQTAISYGFVAVALTIFPTIYYATEL